MHRVDKILSQLSGSDPNHVQLNSNLTSNKIGIFGKHDVGGQIHYGSDDLHYHPASEDDRDKTLTYWERKIDALKVLLQSKKYWTIPESRTTVENLPKKSYLNIAYYEKWMYSTLMLCLKKRLFSETELLFKYQNHPQIVKLKNKTNTDKKPKFSAGEYVQVRGVCSDEIKYESWRLYLGLLGKTHVRSPGYIINKIGIIQSYEGLFDNDELKSLGINDRKVAIYKVRFKQNEVFDNKDLINKNDTIDIEILSHWLQPVACNWSKDDEHIHRDRNIVEQKAIDKEPELSPYQLISEIVIDILTEKGIIKMDELRAFMERVDQAKEYGLGPKIVIRYWRDSKFRENLLRASRLGNANSFLAKEFDANHLTKDIMTLKVMLNTDKIHNVIVCTLCSCYPRSLLGVPPNWYKSLKYRSGMITNPRKLLKNEFGCNITDDVVLNVYDSTSDLRYIVIPHLPSQVIGWQTMNDEELEKRITRDMLIGVKR